jgi:hypothetical protein
MSAAVVLEITRCAHQQSCSSKWSALHSGQCALYANPNGNRHRQTRPLCIDLQPGFATLEWLVEVYLRSRAWERVSTRSRYEYRRALRLVLSHKTKSGTEVGSAPVTSVTARGVDKLYLALQKGAKVERRLRQATLCMVRMARAWDAVHRLYPKVVPHDNPFRGVELDHGKETTVPATRAAAYALHHALIAAGEPHLAVVPLAAYEWHAHSENVIAGHLTWGDYRPSHRPNAVRVPHHKTGEFVWLPLADEHGELFPELTSYLDTLDRIGVSIVLMRSKRTDEPARTFLLRTARRRVREAARKAGLPDSLTLAACRHGGLTELGDAELTEQGVMALSGHRTPEAARLYVKRTEMQRAQAARRRRAWVDAASCKFSKGVAHRGPESAKVVLGTTLLLRHGGAPDGDRVYSGFV